MASYDQLSAQQRAIVDLILKRGQTYDELSDKLGMPETRVRELARQTLVDLAPVSAGAVDEGWRAQIADYLLGQQSPPEAASTRGQLRRSEAARAWSRSVLDSLEHLYPKGELPTIPSGEAGAEPAPAKERKERAPRTPRSELSPAAAEIVRRRRIAGIAAAAVALLFILLIWPVGLIVGGDDSKGDDEASGKIQLVGQAVLEPVIKSGADAQDAGVVIVTKRNDKLDMALQARVVPTGKKQAYEVWLYNSPDDTKSLGAQVTDKQGNFAGRARLPDNFRDYRYVDVSRETVDRNTAHSGQSVLRVATDAIRRDNDGTNGRGGTATGGTGQ